MSDVKCPACRHEEHIVSQFNWGFYACPGCHFLFKYENNKFAKQKEFDNFYDKYLSVGQKGNYNNKTYEVTGILRKRDNEYFKWTEYILQNSDHEFLYLSEYQGNWTILEEVNNLDDLGRKTNGVISLKNENFVQLVKTKTVCNIISAEGFLDFDPNPTIYLSEKRYRDYLISSETINGKTTHFLGKDFNRSNLKKMFGTFKKALPHTLISSDLKPFPLDIKNARIILGITALVLIIFNLAFITPLKQININSEKIFQNEKKTLTTKSFIIPGSLYGTLDINFNSNLDNSWASSDISLVNEQTQQVIYSTKDIEYYHGVDGGESWSEGDQSGQLSICGVKPGKYHLEFSFTFDSATAPKASRIDSVALQLDSISKSINDSAKIKQNDSISNPSNVEYFTNTTDHRYLTVVSKFSRPQYWNLIIVIVFLFICFCIIEKAYFEYKTRHYKNFYDF